MKSSQDDTVRAFATFRIVGDDLIPSEITDILRLFPTKSYAKGEKHDAGRRAGQIIGKTGVWYLATDRIVASNRLVDHLLFLVSVLAPDSTLAGIAFLPKATIGRPIAVAPFFRRLERLKMVMEKRNLRAVVTLFWHGAPGAKHPPLPRTLLTIFRAFSIEIEMDFDTDEQRVA